MRIATLASFLILASVSIASADDTQPPLINHTPVSKANKGDSVAISAQMEDESEIFAPTLYFRYPGARGYSSVAMTRKGDAFVANVQATADIEYWIEAYDEFGNGPTREGSPDRPHRVGVADKAPAKAKVDASPIPSAPAPEAAPPPPEAFDASGALEALPPPSADIMPQDPNAMLPDDEPIAEPVYTQWWFLGAVGVVVAGGVVAAIILAQPPPIYQNTWSASVVRP